MNDDNDDDNVGDDDGDDDDDEALPGVSHVTPLNFKTSRVSVYKCLSLIVGFAVTVAIWPREVVSCRDFILGTVATFWAMSLVGTYPGRASVMMMMMMINFVPQVRLDDGNYEKLNLVGYLNDYCKEQPRNTCDSNSFVYLKTPCL